MSVHTFFTGVRGVVAPLVAFHLIRHVPLATMGWISAGLILLASLLLLPEVRLGQPRRGPAPVSPEVAD
jgi:hypothetical protein